MFGHVLLFSFQGFSTYLIRGAAGEPSRVDVVWVWMCLPRVPTAKVVVLAILHSGSRSSHPSHLLNLLLCTKLWVCLEKKTQKGFTFLGWQRWGPLVDDPTLMQPSWSFFITAWAEPCTRGVRWTSFFSAQAVATLFFLRPGSEGSPALSDHPPGVLA